MTEFLTLLSETHFVGYFLATAFCIIMASVSMQYGRMSKTTYDDYAFAGFLGGILSVLGLFLMIAIPYANISNHEGVSYLPAHLNVALGLVLFSSIELTRRTFGQRIKGWYRACKSKLQTWSLLRRVKRISKTIPDAALHSVRAHLRTVVTEFLPALRRQEFQQETELAYTTRMMTSSNKVSNRKGVKDLHKEARRIQRKQEKQLKETQDCMQECLAFIDLFELLHTSTDGNYEVINLQFEKLAGTVTELRAMKKDAVREIDEAIEESREGGSVTSIDSAAAKRKRTAQ